MQRASLSTMVEVGPSKARSMLGARIGQYEIIRLLGRGGMGEVHLARDLRLGRLVAVKLLMERDPDLDERFLAEARATARCHHENIVVIYEVGAHRGQPYMVLEYLEGQTLRQWLTEHAAATGPPARAPPARAVELMLPVVRALAYAHEQGIIHRDLKPENVMLTRAGVTKVLDFGIAKLVAAPGPDAAVGSEAGPLADSSTLAGTLPYMSPEQLTLGAIDQRVDIWAAGIMLFELVAGARPVLDATARLTATVTDEGTPMPSASERVPELGPLAQIIDRCLIKDAAHRTPRARVLLEELEALAPGRRAAPVGDGGSPFAGLAAFQEADAGRFFGRDRDIEQVVAELRSRPLVAVVGPSGTGKSRCCAPRRGQRRVAGEHVEQPAARPARRLAAGPGHLGARPVARAAHVVMISRARAQVDAGVQRHRRSARRREIGRRDDRRGRLRAGGRQRGAERRHERHEVAARRRRLVIDGARGARAADRDAGADLVVDPQVVGRGADVGVRGDRDRRVLVRPQVDRRRGGVRRPGRVDGHRQQPGRLGRQGVALDDAGLELRAPAAA